MRLFTKKMIKKMTWVLESMVATSDSFQSLVSTTAIVSESHSHLNKIPVQGSQRWYLDCTAAGCRPDASIIFLRFLFRGLRAAEVFWVRSR